MQLEVAGNIVDDDGAGKVSSQHREILDAHVLLQASVLAVESVADAALLIDDIEDGVGILLHRSREDYHFIVLAHFSEEFVAVGPHQKTLIAVHLLEVNESFVQVKH